MKRVLIAAIAAAAVVSLSAADWVVTSDESSGIGQAQAARADLEGTWSARLRTQDRTDAAREPRLQVQMNLDDDRNWSNWGQSFPVSAFTNLPANLDPAQDVTFELRRDAGVIRFQGRFESGRGVGHLFFTANADFVRAIEQQTRDTYNDRELFSFAVMDVSRAFVAELQSLGFSGVTLEDAKKLRIHGTTAGFIRSIRAAGYQDVSLDEILKLRIHGITPQYIDTLKAQGLRNPSLDEVLKFRIHGVTGDYVSQMRAAVLGTDLDDLLQMKIHGVTPAFAREMEALGYKLRAGDLRKFRIHGVTAGYVREMAALGYKNVDADALVRFRIHGITPSFVKELKAAGYEKLSDEELVDWAIHGRRLLKYRRK